MIACLLNVGFLLIMFGLGATLEQLVKIGSCSVGLTMVMVAISKSLDYVFGKDKV